MGIPSYFFHIIRSYGDRFLQKCPITRKGVVNRLFLDLNCCIHGCKNRVLKEYKGDLSTPKEQQRFEDDVIQEVIKTILRFCQETQPQKLLWIAVDGVVPMAKMVQQRERRMRAVEDRERIRGIYEMAGRPTPPEWDSNAITPGTEFMDRMCSRIREHLEWIREQVGVEAIGMNGVDTPGEGEQKIFEYLREHSPSLPKQIGMGGTGEEIGADVVYGLDADLIILSILRSVSPDQTSPIWLLREEQAFGKLITTPDGEDVLHLFKVSEFAKVIPREWGCGGGVSGGRGVDSGELSVLQDYVVLMSLLGNDFVPHTPSMAFRSEGMERILDAYRSVSERLVSPEGVIQWEVLGRVITRLAAQEMPTLLAEVSKERGIRERIRLGQIPFRGGEREDPVEQEVAAMDWEHMGFPDVVNVGTPGWEERYYRGIAGCYGEYSSHKLVASTVCAEYIRSIEWCWNYYNGLPVPMDACFPFASAPLLKDVVAYLETYSQQNSVSCTTSLTITPDYTFRPSPYSQLLAVLPRQSHHLLPEWVRKIADRCPHLYPSQCQMWYWGKRHRWECVSILPEIPIREIDAIVQAHSTAMT